MRSLAGRVLALLLLVCGYTFADTILHSSFESGAEGWALWQYRYYGPGPGAGGPTWITLGGVQGGYIETEDLMDGRSYWVAPASWAGDFYHGTLRFYLRNLGNVERAPTDPLVRLEGGGLSLMFLGGVAPRAQWTFNWVSLGNDPSWWLTDGRDAVLRPATSGEIQTVTQNLTRLLISADWVSGYYGKGPGYGHDVTDVDEITLGSMPEPATIFSAAAALALIALFRQRRRP